MTLYEFNRTGGPALSDEDQKQSHRRTGWMTQGQYPMTRNVERFALNPYAVDSFFVEVWYDPEPNQIDGIRSFSSVRALDDYLPHIWVEWS